MFTGAEPFPSSRTVPCPVLVLGVGNILLRDEGVGVRVVQAMGQMELPPDIELFDGATAGLDLLDALAHRRKVVIIDAVEGDSEPGTVFRLSPEDLLPRQDAGVSLHEIGVLETLTVAERMGTAPHEVVVIGIKPQDVSCGLDLSPEIARRVPEIIELVMAELER
jgi:hydrogenase maturation protease